MSFNSDRSLIASAITSQREQIPTHGTRHAPIGAAAVLATLITAMPATCSGTEADSSPTSQATPAVTLSPAALRRQLRPTLRRIAARYRLDPALLDAVIRVESAYQVDAISSAGAMGLMQLMPETAERFGVENPYDAGANITAGARYLRLLLDRFGTIQLALAAYHAGEGRVARAKNTIPPILATRRYVTQVINQFMLNKKQGL